MIPGIRSTARRLTPMCLAAVLFVAGATAEDPGPRGSLFGSTIRGPLPGGDRRLAAAQDRGRPTVFSFDLASHRRIDKPIGLKGGDPVYVVDQHFQIRARTRNVERLDVQLTVSNRETVARESVVPDANGEAW